MDYKFNIEETKKLLTSTDTFASVLIAIVLAYLPEGEDDLANIEPAALFKNIEEDFQINIPEENENKINAAITAITTDLFWRSNSVMSAITCAFQDGDIGDIPDEQEEELNTCSILWAVLEVGLLNDLTFEESLNNFTKNTADYINNIIDNEAEDIEQVNNSVDTMEEAITTPYYERDILSQLLKLSQQLLTLGVAAGIIAEIFKDFNLTIDQIKNEQN